MQLTGVHHLTAVTADAPANHAFYTRVLGLRLVKRTVNQDDVSAYHLFYADGRGSPGSDLTFFDWPVERERRGTRSIVRTGLRVAGEPTLAWWQRRLAEAGVAHGKISDRDGRLSLDFDDPEGQRLCLVDDGGAGSAHPWAASPVPEPHQIRGLGPVTISVPELNPTEQCLVDVMSMRRVRDYALEDYASTPVHVYVMGDGGPAAELHVAIETGRAKAVGGAGGVHHVAFRIPDAAYADWLNRLSQLGVGSSGPVDRFWFRSIYFREPSGILFEIATDGPGFATDEPLERLGEKLSLPPFLEPRRQEIEAGLKPI